MKRYIVFTFDRHLPTGGFGDYRGSDDLLFKAIEIAEANKDEIMQIIDTETMEIAWSYNWWEEEGKGFKI